MTELPGRDADRTLIMNTEKVLGSRLLDLASKPQSRTEGSGGASFAKSVGEALASANDELKRAEEATRELAAGKGDLVDTMVAMGRADLSLRFVVNMRNRVIESYNEIMRLQV